MRRQIGPPPQLAPDLRREKEYRHSTDFDPNASAPYDITERLMGLRDGAPWTEAKPLFSPETVAGAGLEMLAAARRIKAGVSCATGRVGGISPPGRQIRIGGEMT